MQEKGAIVGDSIFFDEALLTHTRSERIVWQTWIRYKKNDVFSFADRAFGMNWVSCRRMHEHILDWCGLQMCWCVRTYLVRLSTYLATAKCIFSTSFLFSVFDFVLPLLRNTYSLFNHAQKRAANVWRKTAFRRYSTRPWYVVNLNRFVWQLVLLELC